MKKTVLALLVLVIFVLTTGISFAAPTPSIKTNAPLPKEVNIVAPGPDVAPELAAFFGIWTGTWEHDYYPTNTHYKRDSVIIVEKIEGDSVFMVFSLITGQGSSWLRVVGKYNSSTNKVSVPLKSPLTLEDQNATLSINSEGKMIGYRNQYIYDGHKASDYKAVYTKQQ